MKAEVPDLSAIVRRDASLLKASDIGTDAESLDCRPLIDAYYLAVADRRLLLEELRKARDVIDSIADCHGCLRYGTSDAQQEWVASLTALDTLGLPA